MSNKAIATPSRLLIPEYRVESGVNVWRDWRKMATLVKHLTRRALAVRYRGSALGFVWSMLNPVLLMSVYTFVFRFVFRTEVPGVPYTAFFLTGILAWNLVSVGSMTAAVSLLEGNALIKKIAFPRVALPISAVASSAVNYLITLPIVLGFNLLFGIAPSPYFLMLFPCALALLALVALGTGLLLATLIPRFRDLQHLMEVLLVSWFLMSPVLYPVADVARNLTEAQLLIYTLNPMVGIMQLIHAAFLGQPISGRSLILAICGAVALFTVGLWFFQRRVMHVSEL